MVGKFLIAALCIKNIVTWLVIGAACLLALTTFIALYLESVEKGEKIFLPGVGALFLAVLLLFFYSVTRIIKYVRILRVKEISKEQP